MLLCVSVCLQIQLFLFLMNSLLAMSFQLCLATKVAFCGSSECKKEKCSSASQRQSSETLALEVNGTKAISTYLRAQVPA